MNLEIYNFKQNMVNLINNSQLPVGIVLEIMKNLLPELEKIFMNEIQKDLGQQGSIDQFEDTVDLGDVSGLDDKEIMEELENETN